MFTSTFVSNRQVNTLLIAASTDLGTFTAFIKVTKVFRFVGPISTVVFAVANSFHRNAHFAVTATIEFGLKIAANFGIT